MTSDDPIEVEAPPDSGAENGGASPAKAAGPSANATATPTDQTSAVAARESPAPSAEIPAAPDIKTATPRPAAATAKPASAKPSPAPKPAPIPPAPFVAKPSIPVSMINTPADAANDPHATASRFPGEVEEDFETALARVRMSPRRGWIAARIGDAIARMIPGKSGRRSSTYADVRRVVAFDGFTTNLHDDKLERDRRYGTVYSVREEINAYLVRLEMPRRMPNSSLRRAWNLPDEMPDYEYSLCLRDGVLAIDAGVPGEACRRLSYVSPSFPADFLTRIEFAKPVSGFRHRLRDKVLEIIVFKRDENFRSAA